MKNVLENYEITEKISEGGFGRIFKARHKLLDELACIKQNINTTEQDVELLRTEAKLLWRLSEYHSIPHAKDFYRIDDKNAILVMSYIEGTTLEGIISAKGRGLHPEDASWITERLLGALYYA